MDMYEARQNKKPISHTFFPAIRKEVQSFHYRNNRSSMVVYQFTKDLDNQFADLLNIIRLKCEDAMWGRN